MKRTCMKQRCLSLDAIRTRRLVPIEKLTTAGSDNETAENAAQVRAKVRQQQPWRLYRLTAITAAYRCVSISPGRPTA